jgi:hypothetical protein
MRPPAAGAVKPVIRAALGPDRERRDCVSGSGSSHAIGKAVATADVDRGLPTRRRRHLSGKFDRPAVPVIVTVHDGVPRRMSRAAA